MKKEMLIIIAIILAILICWVNLHITFNTGGWVNAGMEMLIVAVGIILLHGLLLFALIGTAKNLSLGQTMLVWGVLIFIFLIPVTISFFGRRASDIEFDKKMDIYERIHNRSATMNDFSYICNNKIDIVNGYHINRIDINYEDKNELMYLVALKEGYREIADTILTVVCDTSSNSIFDNSSLGAGYIEEYGKEVARKKILGIWMIDVILNEFFDDAKHLLALGADVNVMRDNTPLTVAIWKKQLDFVRLFLEQGADVNLTTKYSSPLIDAVSTGQLDIIRLLLKRGADVNLTVYDSSPLIAAIEKGDSAIIRLLLDRGADVNLTAIETSPLMTAVGAGSYSTIQLLLDRGADVNLMIKVKEKDTSPLIYAVKAGDNSMVQFLLERGADVNAVDNCKWDALVYAVGNNNVDVAKLLIKYGADVGRKYPREGGSNDPYEPLLYFADGWKDITDFLTNEYHKETFKP